MYFSCYIVVRTTHKIVLGKSVVFACLPSHFSSDLRLPYFELGNEIHTTVYIKFRTSKQPI